MDNEALYRRIQELLTLKGMTVSELERLAGVSNSTIVRWQKSTPSADKLQKVAKILGTTIDFLITGEEDNGTNKIIAREISTLTPKQINLIHQMIETFKESNE